MTDDHTPDQLVDILLDEVLELRRQITELRHQLTNLRDQHHLDLANHHH